MRLVVKVVVLLIWKMVEPLPLSPLPLSPSPLLLPVSPPLPQTSHHNDPHINAISSISSSTSSLPPLPPLSTSCLYSISSSSFSSLPKRLVGTILLDMEESDFPHIINAIVEEMIDVGQIKKTNRQDVLKALLLKHRYAFKDASLAPGALPMLVVLGMLVVFAMIFVLVVLLVALVPFPSCRSPPCFLNFSFPFRFSISFFFHADALSFAF